MPAPDPGTRMPGDTRRPRPRSRPTRLLAVMAAALLAFAACGSSDDDDTDAVDAGDAPAADDNGSTGDADVTVIADDIDFPTTEFAANAGEITIQYVNEGNIRHTLVIEGVDAWDKLEVPNNGATDRGTVELEPGEYTLFCDVAGHRGAGMEGTLTVS